MNGNVFKQSHFLVMSLVPDASMFAIPAALAQQLFEPACMTMNTGGIASSATNTQKAADICGLPMPPTEVAEFDADVADAAKVRLQSLGKVLFADLCLYSRDRFLPPPFVSVATVDCLLRKEAGEAPLETTDMRAYGDADSYLRLLQNCIDPTMLRYLAGNVDNTLLQDASSARDARFSFIDNIANEMGDVKWYEGYLSAVLSETVSDGGPLQSNVAQFEFIRWILRVACNSFVASDAALRE